MCGGACDPEIGEKGPAGFLRSDLYAGGADRESDHGLKHLEGIPRAKSSVDRELTPPHWLCGGGFSGTFDFESLDALDSAAGFGRWD